MARREFLLKNIAPFKKAFIYLCIFQSSLSLLRKQGPGGRNTIEETHLLPTMIKVFPAGRVYLSRISQGSRKMRTFLMKVYWLFFNGVEILQTETALKISEYIQTRAPKRELFDNDEA